MPLLSVCRKTQGLIRGRSPLWLYSDLATCAANPQKALAQQGFPCIRCWPRHRRKHRMKKLEKVAFSHFFDSPRRISRRPLSLSVICVAAYKLPQYGCWRYLVLYVRVQYVIQEFHYIPGHGIVLALRRHLLKKGIDVLLKHGHLIE